MMTLRSCRMHTLALLSLLLATHNAYAAKRAHVARTARSAKSGAAAAAVASGLAVARLAPGQDPATTGTCVAKMAAPTEPVAADVLKPFYGQKVERGPATTPLIALSFDDGPSPKLTPMVLDILKKEGIKANFFMIGQEVQQYPEYAKAVADAGMELGCHSMTHPNLGRKTPDVIRQEITGSQAIVEQATGKKPAFFRAPGGVVNQAVRQVCAEDGMIICGWSVDPKDWDPRSTPDSVYNVTMRQVHGGAIVCIHDIHKKTIEALPRIIAELKSKGYVFTTISQLVAENAKSKVAMPGGFVPVGGGMPAGGALDGMGGDPGKPAAIKLSDSAVK